MLLSFHSYKGGTGKTTFVGNLGAMLAQNGQKVCIIDTDVSGPGIHSLFDIKYQKTLIDFLQGACSAKDVVYRYNGLDLFIVPSRACEEDISVLFKTPQDAKAKMLELVNFIKDEFNIDKFIFDCSPGINKSSLLIMNIVNKATIISTIDVQDIRGTYILSSMADKLGTRANLMFNRTPKDKQKDIDGIVQDFSDKLGTNLLGSIPFDELVARTWSRKIAMLDNPECDYCYHLKEIADKLI